MESEEAHGPSARSESWAPLQNREAENVRTGISEAGGQGQGSGPERFGVSETAGKGLKMLMRDWSKEKLEAGIEKTCGRLAALDAFLFVNWSGSGMEKHAMALRKYRKALNTDLKNMERVLKGKRASKL